MEGFLLKSRKNEAKRLVKQCFKNPMFSLVPFEIWRDMIVSNADLKAVTLLAQTCWGFKEIVDSIGENNFNLALMLRKEGQVDLAKKYLLKCAENNNATAMFHLGYAHYSCGWGFKQNSGKSLEWVKKSAKLGNTHAMVFCCLYLGSGKVVEDYAKKALSSKDSFAIGFCHFHGFGTKKEMVKSLSFFEASALEGDELGQYQLACFYSYGWADKTDKQKAFYWYLKSAEQGNCKAQCYLAQSYLYGTGCDKDKAKAIVWFKKSAKLGYDVSANALKIMGFAV